MTERNVLGGELDPCGTDPVTGFYRDGTCTVGPQDAGLHAICAMMTAEFLAHQASVGNDLSTPRPEWHFPGLAPGDRWCVVAVRWLQSYGAGVPAPVVLSATSERALEVVPLEVLQGFHPAIEKDVYLALSLRGSLEARNTLGGTAPAQVRAQIARHRTRLT